MSKGPKKLRPKSKPAPKFGLLPQLARLGYQHVIGVDEVGRGALAGPLIVAAVELPQKIDGITDSKLLNQRERQALAGQIRRLATQIALGWASAPEINQIGLTRATALAYQRALQPITADLILTDFIRLPGRAYISQPRGDQYFYPTAAASIIAKVYRDQLMRVYHQFLPQYSWQTNVGYGTPSHWHALTVHGSTLLHRESFLQRLKKT